ncbi:type IX secretion system anionic LPS delivery protein PorZ [Nafulsella turpanensis]|uniref:type IX secretion system anionic LPS delivery protein PorZ n=1 Tax=Nafulsella turpanensis TaxID=1265690 RepID=UPI00034501BD|nr:hypothetical protein [Nafulsella turpanensis]
MKKILSFSLLLAVLFPSVVLAQANIPLDTWRTHFSYLEVQELAVAEERIYAASDNGLFYFDTEDNSLTRLTTSDGLSDAGVGILAYDEPTQSLLLVYRNGNVDVVQEGEIFSIKTIHEAAIPGERSSNDAVFEGRYAYLAMDYGISKLDLALHEIEESYLNLGSAGETTEVYQLAIWNDSLFAATEAGLLANALQGANLADFNNWRRYPVVGQVAGRGNTLAVAEGKLYAGVDGEGLFVYESGQWSPTTFQTDQEFRALEASETGLLITLEEEVHIFQPEQAESMEVESRLVDAPHEALLDRSGTLWIADGSNGLLGGKPGGSFNAFVPSGPLADVPVKLYTANEQVIALFNAAGAEGNGLSGFSVFSEGSWQNYIAGQAGMPAFVDFTDVVYNPVNKRYYFSSASDGLLEWSPATGEFVQFAAGLPGMALAATADGKTPVTALAVDAAGVVWMVQPQVDVPLVSYKPADGRWLGYLRNTGRAGAALQLLALPNNDKWLRLPGEGGVLVFNEEKDVYRILGEENNEGDLSEASVTTLAEDLEGQIWLGLAEGINYIPNPYTVLTDANVNAALPVYDRRALLSAERITALAVDGGNRKWIGTPNGLWVFGDYGDTLYHHFTSANSPLPGNYIVDISVRPQNGEAFIATQQGIVSYRSAATVAEVAPAASVKVFPNPVYPSYEGMVGITGLPRDAIVKITDASGRLVKELQAEGGTASWNMTDWRGRRPGSGIYMIFTASEDGEEALVGKLAIIN